MKTHDPTFAVGDSLVPMAIAVRGALSTAISGLVTPMNLRDFKS
jgi:hypothetical protein